MKRVIIIWILCLSVINTYCQNFIQLHDATGYERSEGNVDSLEAITSRLILSFTDTAFHSQFRVYESGYYIHNEVMVGDGSIDSQWSATLESVEANSSIPFYLVLGKVLYGDGRKEIRVKVNLPTTSNFYCLDNISPGFRNEIESNIYYKANQDFNSYDFYENERTAISSLQYILDNKICCDVSNRGVRSETCNACFVQLEDIIYNINNQPIYPSSKEFGRLLDKDFQIDFVEIIQDNEYFIPDDNPSFTSRGIGSRNNTAINATISFEQEGQALVDNLIAEIVAGTGVDEVFIYKYPRDCGQFDDIWNQYTSYSGTAIFVSLINIDRVNGFLAYHQKVTPISNVHSSNSNNRSSTTNPTEDDLEGMREALLDAKCSCWDALLAYGNVFEYNADYFFARLYLSKKERDYYEKHYKEKKQRVYSARSEAKAEYNYYYDMEWHIEKKENNRWDWTASALAHYHMCRELVHGVLDMCGVIEPIGIICDGTNSVLYFLSGDKLNGSLSLSAIIPVIGTPGSLTKISTKVAITAAGSPAGVVYRATTKAGTNFIHWVGGSGKLARVMSEVGGTPAFCKINDALNTSAREIHHLIPWSLTDYKNTNRFLASINKKLADAGWHPSNPFINGYDIPKYFRGGEAFHGSHENYIKWVEDALNKIDIAGLEGQTLLTKMEELSVFLRMEIAKAYGNGISKTQGGTGKSLHQYFAEPFPKFKL